MHFCIFVQYFAIVYTHMLATIVYMLYAIGLRLINVLVFIAIACNVVMLGVHMQLTKAHIKCTHTFVLYTCTYSFCKQCMFFNLLVECKCLCRIVW